MQIAEVADKWEVTVKSQNHLNGINSIQCQMDFFWLESKANYHSILPEGVLNGPFSPFCFVPLFLLPHSTSTPERGSGGNQGNYFIRR